MTIRVLINPINQKVPESGPIMNSINSRYRMTREQVSIYEGMAVVPHSEPKKHLGGNNRRSHNIEPKNS